MESNENAGNCLILLMPENLPAPIGLKHAKKTKIGRSTDKK